MNRGARPSGARRAVLLLVAGTLALTACGGDDGDDGGDTPGAGGSGGGGGGLPDVIRVGVLDDLTGPAAFCGTDELEGMEAAVAEVTEAGRFGSSTIELVTEDTASTPERAVSGYQALVESDVVGILGPCVSSAAAAVVQRPASDEIPLILTTSGAADLTEPEWVYRAGVVSVEYAPSMVDALVERGITSTAIIVSTENPVHTTLAEDVFRPGFEEAGIELAIVEEITPETQDLSAQITNIRAEGVEAIGVIATGDANRTIVEQLREAGLDQLVWGQIGMQNENYIGAGDTTDGTIFITSFAPCFSDVSAAFAERYEEAVGESPTFAAAHGYDAAMRLFAAIEAAGSVDRGAINTALVDDVTTLDGAQGAITFDELGNATGAGGVVEISGGELVCG